MLKWYLRWTKTEVPWWKVWDPRSGLVGGMIIVVVFTFLGWLVSHWLTGR